MSQDDLSGVGAAKDWFAKMRGPDADAHRADFEAWQSADLAHAEAFARLSRRFDQSTFLAHTAIGRERNLERAAVWWRQPIVRYVAAALLVTLALSSLLVSGVVGTTPSRAAHQVFTSKIGQLQRVAFARGGSITLDSDSAASVTTDGQSLRVRLLKGRARVTTVPIGRDILVEYNAGTVSTRDGELDVCLSGSALVATLWRGSATATSTTRREPIALRADQRIEIRASAIVGPTSVRRDERAWTEGMLAFEGTTLAQARDMLNRYNEQKLALATAELGTIRISGTFRAADPAGFARAIAGMFKLRVETGRDGTLTLHK